MGDRRVGEHLKKVDVRAGDSMLGAAPHTAVETEEGAWLGWRTAGDFKAGTVGVTSACLKDYLDLLEEFSRRVESTAGS